MVQLRIGLYRFAQGMVCIAAIATGLSFLSFLYWGFALLTHLRFQYVLMLLGGWGLSVLCQKQRPKTRDLLLWLIPLSLNSFLLAPIVFPAQVFQFRPSLPVEAPRLTIQHLNLDRHHPHRDRVIDYLNQQTADVIWLQEVTPAWLNQLNQKLTTYTVVEAIPKENSHGSALLQHHTADEIDVISTQVEFLPPYSQRPLLSAVLQWQGQPITVLSFHVTRPRSAPTTAFQQVELAAIATWIQQQQSPTQSIVVLGDFNSTPWSRAFRTFQQQSGLTLAQHGIGLKPTWPAQLLTGFKIPIDNCLHSPSLHTLHYRVGPSVGSDHHPIEVQLTRD